MADEPTTEDTLVVAGESIKSIEVKDGKARVGSYAIRFSGPEQKDLAGEFFSAETDFGPRNGDGAVTMFNHGEPISDALEHLAHKTFAPVKATKDEIGIFIETCLDLADEYEAAINHLVQKGKLKWSSGTAAHLMRKSADGHILRWHPIEFSYTPTPCESRLPAITPLKSVAALDPAIAAEMTTAFAETKPAEAAVDIIPKTEPAKSLPAKITLPRMTTEELAAQKAENEKANLEVRNARRAEDKEILALGNQFKCLEKAQEFIAGDKSANEFKSFVLTEVAKAKTIVTDPNIGMGKKEVKAWSMLKALREAHAGGLTGLEKEASAATAKALGKNPNGFFIPNDVAIASLAEVNDLGANAIKSLAYAIKNLNQTTFASGGALVGTDLLTGSLIELLRNKPLVSQMGAMTLSGLQGNIAIPLVSGGATSYWLNEQGSVTATDQAFGQLGLTPKRLVGRTGYTKELMNQTDLSVEALVRNDIITVLSLAKDLAALAGTGGSQPLGIINTTGIGSVTFSAAATRAKLIEFQSAVATANASRGALAYMTTPAAAAKQMNIPETTYSTKFIWDGNIDSGMVVGRRAESTNQVPSDKVIYGNWNDLILADWAGIDVVVNPYTNDATGVVTITITLWTDCGVRHAVSFVVSTDSGAQ